MYLITYYNIIRIQYCCVAVEAVIKLAFNT